jgi:hypothetical protein
MLAIVSDIDNTQLHDFMLYHQFLNTRDNTLYGEGLELDVGDSFWMFGPKSDSRVMSWWIGHDTGEVHCADAIQQGIRDGWIDTIHTYGDFEEGTFHRDLAQKAVAELQSLDLPIRVWINHGGPNNSQNFPGSYRRLDYMKGDISESLSYHTDITLGFGVRYFQSHDVAEFGSSFPLAPYACADGRKIWGFARTSRRHQSLIHAGLGILLQRIFEQLKSVGFPSPRRYPFKAWTWHPEHLNEQLSHDNLRALIRNQHFALIGQHLGYRGELPRAAVRALRRLKSYQVDGNILVTRTSRLLDYAVSRNYLCWMVDHQSRVIQVDRVEDPVTGPRVPSLDELRGITFVGSGIASYSIRVQASGLRVSEDELDRGEDRIGIRWFRPA